MTRRLALAVRTLVARALAVRTLVARALAVRTLVARALAALSLQSRSVPCGVDYAISLATPDPTVTSSYFYSTSA